MREEMRNTEANMGGRGDLVQDGAGSLVSHGPRDARVAPDVPPAPLPPRPHPERGFAPRPLDARRVAACVAPERVAPPVLETAHPCSPFTTNGALTF